MKYRALIFSLYLELNCRYEAWFSCVLLLPAFVVLYCIETCTRISSRPTPQHRADWLVLGKKIPSVVPDGQLRQVTIRIGISLKFYTVHRLYYKSFHRVCTGLHVIYSFWTIFARLLTG